MKNRTGLVLASALLLWCFAGATASAAPILLEGMGITSQWIDLETGSGEMPANPWGNSDLLNADRVGIYVEYQNGLTGSATYSGIANNWGGCCGINGGLGISPSTETGFFVGSGSYAGLHGIDNNGFILPMAFSSLTNQFTNNFDLSYENFGNSTWRASVPGWNSVQITLYSSTAAVPEPASMLLLGTGLLGAGVLRWRQKRT